MKKKVFVLLSALVLVAMTFAACQSASPAAEAPTTAEAPVGAVVAVVSAEIVPDEAVQSLPDAEILGYVYLDVNGGVTSSSGLNVPAEWDGTKPPQPMYVGNKLDGASQLFCELDVDLTTNEQTVYRCGYPGKG